MGSPISRSATCSAGLAPLDSVSSTAGGFDHEVATTVLVPAGVAGLGGNDLPMQGLQRRHLLVERMVSVPDTLPWEQQVQLAEQERAQRSALGNLPAPVQQQGTVTQSSGSGRQAECANLNAQISQLDALARQPQSGQSQDRITSERRSARDRQFSLHC